MLGQAMFEFTAMVSPAFSAAADDVKRQIRDIMNIKSSNAIANIAKDGEQSLKYLNVQMANLRDQMKATMGTPRSVNSLGLPVAATGIHKYAESLASARIAEDRLRNSRDKLNNSLIGFNATLAANRHALSVATASGDVAGMRLYGAAVTSNTNRISAINSSLANNAVFLSGARLATRDANNELKTAKAAYAEYSAVLAEASKEHALLTKRLFDMGFMMGKVAVSAAIPAAVIGSIMLTTRSAANFDYEMRKVKITLEGLYQESYPNLKGQVLDVAVAYGQSSKDVANALYDLTSSGYNAYEAMSVLNVGIMASRAGFASTANTVDTLITIMKSYGMDASEAGRVSDILFNVVKRGRVEFAELAPQIGRVSSAAAEAGISLEELGTMYTMLTIAGQRAGIATTGIGAIIRDLLKPSVEAQVMAYRDFGLVLNESTVKSKGLLGIMKALERATAEQLLVMFPQIRSQRAVLALRANLIQSSAQYEYLLRSEGATMEAYNKVQDSMRVQLDKVESALEKLMITWGEVGNKLSPVVGAFASMIDGLANGFKSIEGVGLGLAILLGVTVTSAVLFLSIAMKALTMATGMTAASMSTFLTGAAWGAGWYGAIVLGVGAICAALYRLHELLKGDWSFSLGQKDGKDIALGGLSEGASGGGRDMSNVGVRMGAEVQQEKTTGMATEADAYRQSLYNVREVMSSIQKIQSQIAADEALSADARATKGIDLEREKLSLIGKQLELQKAAIAAGVNVYDQSGAMLGNEQIRAQLREREHASLVAMGIQYQKNIAAKKTELAIHLKYQEEMRKKMEASRLIGDQKGVDSAMQSISESKAKALPLQMDLSINEQMADATSMAMQDVKNATAEKKTTPKTSDELVASELSGAASTRLDIYSGFQVDEARMQAYNNFVDKQLHKTSLLKKLDQAKAANGDERAQQEVKIVDMQRDLVLYEKEFLGLRSKGNALTVEDTKQYTENIALMSRMIERQASYVDAIVTQSNLAKDAAMSSELSRIKNRTDDILRSVPEFGELFGIPREEARKFAEEYEANMKNVQTSHAEIVSSIAAKQYELTKLEAAGEDKQANRLRKELEALGETKAAIEKKIEALRGMSKAANDVAKQFAEMHAKARAFGAEKTMYDAAGAFFDQMKATGIVAGRDAILMEYEINKAKKLADINTQIVKVQEDKKKLELESSQNPNDENIKARVSAASTQLDLMFKTRDAIKASSKVLATSLQSSAVSQTQWSTMRSSGAAAAFAPIMEAIDSGDQQEVIAGNTTKMRETLVEILDVTKKRTGNSFALAGP